MKYDTHTNYNRNMGKKELMNYIDCTTFAVIDCGLYLDTHPTDKRALEYFKYQCECRNEAVAEYAKRFGPLTLDLVNMSDEDYWNWIDQPWPWEGGYC